MKLPEEVLEKFEDLAKTLAIHKMSAEVEVSKPDKGACAGCPDKGPRAGCPDKGSCTGCPDKANKARDESDSSNGELLSSLQSLLDGWSERDEDTDAGSYYNDLKRVVDEHSGNSNSDDAEEELEEEY